MNLALVQELQNRYDVIYGSFQNWRIIELRLIENAWYRIFQVPKRLKPVTLTFRPLKGPKICKVVSLKL